MPVDRDISYHLAQGVKEMLSAMRLALKDDRVYRSVIHRVEGWCFGERSWLDGVLGVEQPTKGKGKAKSKETAITSIPLPVIEPPTPPTTPPTGD